MKHRYKKSKSVKKSVLVKKVTFEDNSLPCTDEQFSNDTLSLCSEVLNNNFDSSMRSLCISRKNNSEVTTHFGVEMLFSFFLEASEYIDLNEDKLLRLKANDEMLNTINLFLEHIH